MRLTNISHVFGIFSYCSFPTDLIIFLSQPLVALVGSWRLCDLAYFLSLFAICIEVVWTESLITGASLVCVDIRTLSRS